MKIREMGKKRSCLLSFLHRADRSLHEGGFSVRHPLHVELSPNVSFRKLQKLSDAVPLIPTSEQCVGMGFPKLSECPTSSSDEVYWCLKCLCQWITFGHASCVSLGMTVQACRSSLKHPNNYGMDYSRILYRYLWLPEDLSY